MLSSNQVFPSPFPNGAVLLIDKPLGWSSFDVVNKVRYLLAQRLGIKPKKLKVGHAGTLDPLATGLLILCVGTETKKIELYQAQTKTYDGAITFGAVTDSFDLEKPVSEHSSVETLSDSQIQQALSSFIGEITQVPPAFSAVKVDGERLYKNARTGALVEMPFRTVRVDAFNLGSLHPLPKDLPTEMKIVSRKGAQIALYPEFTAGKQATFEVVCGKGTYIRSLVNDLGQAVGTGAYLSSLRRTASGEFSLNNAWQLSDFEKWVKSE
jgi:tRNA pseudouridine55 synthase